MNSELARRIVFTLGALLVYRFGTYIPLPGVQVYSQLLGTGRTVPVSIFSLWILPYLTAAILIQLVSMVSSKLGALPRSGEAGRRKIRRYTIGLAVLLTVFQAYGVASGLQSSVPNLINDPDGLFVLSATVTLTGGTVFLVWLSEQITAYGIGNGLAVLLFAGIAVKMPGEIATMLELTRQGAVSGGLALLLAILWTGLVAVIVFVELARRRVPVEFAARKLGDRLIPAQSSHLSFKLNSAGIIPAFVGPWLYLLPLSVAGVMFEQNSPWWAAASQWLSLTHPGHMILGSIAIVLVALVYTAFLVDPDHAADSLLKRGGVLPGVMPGGATAEHIDGIVSRTAWAGAVYLAAIFLIPEALLRYFNTPFYLDGSSALIMVCTVLDLTTQVRGLTLTRPGGAYS
jgi:preprotein translocase subunit SecY